MDESLTDKEFQFQSEKVQLNSALMQKQSMINDLTAKLNEQEGALKILKEDANRLKTETSDQKALLLSKETAIGMMNDQTKKLQDDIEKYKKEVGSLKKKIGQLQKPAK